MASADLLPAAVLKRKAVVYIRQSTQAQVHTNREGRRRQYELVEVARQRGFRDVEVIDDDLGRSASARRRAPASTGSWPGCAPERSAPCWASTPRGARATDAIGITGSNCAGWSTHG